MTENLCPIASSRIGLAALNAQDVVLCATSRLARELRHEYDRRQQAAGLERWATLGVVTVEQWLNARLDEAALMGRMPENAPQPLGSLQERILWLDAIESASQGQADAVLFDQAGMAQVAAEANALAVAWPVHLPSRGGVEGGEETRQFLRWREAFRERCASGSPGISSRWLEEARYFDWQLDRLAEGVVDARRLPGRVAFAGFDRYKPQEERLAGVLRSLGVAVFELEQGLAETAAVTVHALPDRRAECQAAVSWVRRQWQKNPQARLGIVVPELGDLRTYLADRLDDELAPHTVSPGAAQTPRAYNFTLGTPLSRQPLVVCALRLLGLLARPHRVMQKDFGLLLRDPLWSDWSAEADARALMEAAMRRHLPASFSLDKALSFLGRHVHGRQLKCLMQHLSAAREHHRSLARRQSAPEWSAALRDLLKLGGWPGSRPLSSHEYQAMRAFEASFAQLDELGQVLGKINMSTALGHLSQICLEQIFQPQTEGEPALQVMGLLESCGTPMDALWVMGMNDHLWPPAARPNPLLPAQAQREAGTPNASAGVQAEFAATVQRRLMRSALEVVFSYAESEGDREMRPSPLIAPWLNSRVGLIPEEQGQGGLLERLMNTDAARFECFVDRHAPPVGEGEHLHGGTALLKAQAICPAWAFYRYRLGARQLEIPLEGLDEAERGTLLHKAMQCFWEKHGEAGQPGLKGMGEVLLAENIARAVDEAIAFMKSENDAALPARFMALEAGRLRDLLGEWLALERERPVSFTVLACEQENRLVIEGIEIHLFIDRIDRLESGAGGQSGQRMVLDYKTGSQVSHKTWADERIREPQLPIYAAFLPAAEGAGEIAAVVFGRVRQADCRFIGIAGEGGLLPGVAGISEDEARKVFDTMGDWPGLLEHWRSRIRAIALEIRAGEAAVFFDDEKDLVYCDVKPLLRLAERRVQQESVAEFAEDVE